MMDLNIKMIDWETLTAPKGPRLIGFGRYAGIVGCYNSFLAYGKKTGDYQLKPAHTCEDHNEINQELKKCLNVQLLLASQSGISRHTVSVKLIALSINPMIAKILPVFTF